WKEDDQRHRHDGDDQRAKPPNVCEHPSMPPSETERLPDAVGRLRERHGRGVLGNLVEWYPDLVHRWSAYLHRDLPERVHVEAIDTGGVPAQHVGNLEWVDIVERVPQRLTGVGIGRLRVR